MSSFKKTLEYENVTFKHLKNCQLETHRLLEVSNGCLPHSLSTLSSQEKASLKPTHSAKLTGHKATGVLLSPLPLQCWHYRHTQALMRMLGIMLGALCVCESSGFLVLILLMP